LSTLTKPIAYAAISTPSNRRIQQARFALPRETDWKGLKLKAAIEAKGVRPSAVGLPPGVREGRLPEAAPHVRG
jgi:hypothetical protein